MKKRTSIRFSWLLSYFLIFLIPFLFSVFLCTLSFQSSKEQIDRTNQIYLENIQKHFDTMITEILNLSFTVENNNSLSTINRTATPQDGLNSVNPYLLYQTTSHLRDEMLTKSSINSVMLYFRNSDSIVSNFTNRQSDDFFQIYYSNRIENYQEWHSIISGSYSGSFVNYSSPENEKETYWIETVYLPGQSSVNIIFDLNMEYLYDALRQITKLNQGELIILNPQGNLMFSSLPDEYNIEVMDEFYFPKLRGESPSHTLMLENSKMYASVICSSLSSYSYISLVPYQTYWAESFRLQWFSVVSILVCTVLCCLLILFLLKKNYGPIRQLIYSLPNWDGSGFDPNQIDEFRFIAEKISQLDRQRQQIENQAYRQQKLLRGLFLSRLIRGVERQEDAIELSLNRYEINFQSNYFVVATIYCGDLDLSAFSGFCTGHTEDPYQITERAHFVINNIFEELLNQHHFAYLTEIDGMPVALINLKKRENWQKSLKNAAEQLKAVLLEKFNTPLLVCIGDMHRGISGIPQSYQESTAVLEYLQITEENSVCFYTDILGDTKNCYFYPLESEQMLLNALNVMDLDRASSVISAILEKNLEQNHLSLDLAKCLIADMTSTLMKAIMSTEYSCYHEFMESFHFSDSISKCRSYNDLRSLMEEVMHKYEDCIKKCSDHRESEADIYHKIVSYADTHYTDGNLSVGTLAEEIGLSPIMASKIYRRYSQNSLLDYINYKRIEASKKLLVDSSLTLEEVALQCGFGSTKTFTRSFKKYENITPGRYRSQYRSADTN